MVDTQATHLTTPSVHVGEKRLYQRLKNRLWGYDYFISYHWLSGGQYAIALAQRLIDRGYDCFLDRTEYAMGDDWKREGERALRHTQRLVLVATREAVTESKPVQREVDIFTARSRHIIPIIFGDRFTDSERKQYPVLAKIPDSQLYIDEHPDSLESGPSGNVVEQLIRTDRVLRRRTLRTRIVTGVITILLVALAAVGMSLWRTNRALESERLALENEQRERRVATAREYVATSQALRADSPETSLLMTLHARHIFDGTDQPIPFYVHAAVFNSLERIGGIGLGREDGTVQVARIEDNRLYTGGVVSDVFRIRDISDSTLKTVFDASLPPIDTPSLSFSPRQFSFSPDNRWVAALGNSRQQELALVDMTYRDTQTVPYRLPENSNENSDLNLPSRPVFGTTSTTLFFVDRTSHLHRFGLNGNRWQHEATVDLFPNSDDNPQLRFVPKSFVQAEHLAYILSTDEQYEIRVLDLNDLSRRPLILFRSHNGERTTQLTNLASAGAALYAWELNGNVPFRAWRLSKAGDSEFESVSIDLPTAEESDRHRSRLIAISPSGQRIVCQSTGGDTFIYTVARGFAGELPRFLRKAWFSPDDRNLFTVEEDSSSGKIVSVLKILPLGDQLAPVAKELLTYQGTIFDAASSDDGQLIVVNAYNTTPETWLATIDNENNIVQSEFLAIHAKHRSPDLRHLSDGNRLWDRQLNASMHFPMRNRIEREQGTDFYMLPTKRVVYIDNDQRCILGELLANGKIREISLLGENITAMALNTGRTNAVVATMGECQFWSTSDTSTGPERVAMSHTEVPFYARLSDSGRFALIAVDAKSNRTDETRILVVDRKNPANLVELEAADDFMSLRFEWVRDNIALISSANTPAAVSNTVFDVAGQPISESTRIYAINGEHAEKLQEVNVGGQWVARSSNGKTVCILSTNAEQRGDERLGTVFTVSDDGMLRDGKPIIKNKGQRRVEDISVSADGEWIGIAGNSPALFSRSQDHYEPIFLEVDNDRIDELVFDPSGIWALSFSHSSWRSWVALWHLKAKQPNTEKIRIQTAEGHNTAGRAMNVRFGHRHISFADDEAGIIIDKQLFRIPLTLAHWTSTASHMVGRNLTQKEIRENLSGRQMDPIRPDWRLPLSIEAWEGTH